MSGMNKDTLNHVMDVVARVCGECKGSDKKEEILKEINQRVIFDPELDKLYYKHRELVQEDDDFFGQGFGQCIEVGCRTQGASLYIDSKGFDINYADDFVIEMTKERQDLICLQVENEES